MKRNTQVVVLCEDKQHRTFALRFLKGKGWHSRQIRTEMSLSGSAAQFVRDRFPKELVHHRRRAVSQILLVMIDGDGNSVDQRIAELNQACTDHECPIRKPSEKVAVLVPNRSIETWLAYLGGDSVDEKTQTYPRLDRERDCHIHVKVLSDMCDDMTLRQPAPESLSKACLEFRRLRL